MIIEEGERQAASTNGKPRRDSGEGRRRGSRGGRKRKDGEDVGIAVGGPWVLARSEY